MTREQWLLNAIGILEKEKFAPLGHKFNKIRVSIGFTSTKKAIGEWWKPESTVDGHSTIFIHPGQGDVVDVLQVLVHELVHDSVGIKAGHGPTFKKLALAVGLEGKMRSTHAGEALKKYLKTIAKRIGDFPHSQLKPNAKPPTPKQTTRMVKMECGDCGYKCRAALTVILNTGAVICPCNHETMTVEVPE